MIDRKLLNDPSYTALLSLDYGVSSGSGFHLNHNSSKYLVTARHVLFNHEKKVRCSKLVVTSQNIRGREDESQIIEIDIPTATIIPSDTDDVALILLEVAGVKENCIKVIQAGNLNCSYIDSTITRGINEIKIANEVFLIGHPTSLIAQGTKYFDISRPLLRRGIISGFNLQDKTFIIDCPAYYGNSGGPILEIGEDDIIRLIGIVSLAIPFVITWKNNRETTITNNEFSISGYSVCVPIDAIFTILR